MSAEGIYKKGDIIEVRRTDSKEGATFQVELDSSTGLNGENVGEESVLVRAGGVLGVRIDRLYFTSAKKLRKNGRTKVIQVKNTLNEKVEAIAPLTVVVKKVK